MLFRDNGLSLSKSTVFYVPVSVIGKPSRKKSWFLYELLDIPKHQKIILYFGQIGKARYTFELARVAQNFPNDWTLVMHGWGSSSEIEEIKAVDYRKKVAMSLEMVSSDRIIDVISSADVGLALYSSTISNDRLTHLSSEKMALYAQCGVPFVAFDYQGYRHMADEDKWGVVITTVEELPAAVAKILEAHDEYRRNANIAFERYYDFADNATRFIKAIDRF
ncbi:MAG: glycosyltransferase [Actinomycetota bacterium]|nr:glycosyltransferase [Actinomycetota bacterium]